jgi:hypothetical protein
MLSKVEASKGSGREYFKTCPKGLFLFSRAGLPAIASRSGEAGGSLG